MYDLCIIRMYVSYTTWISVIVGAYVKFAEFTHCCFLLVVFGSAVMKQSGKDEPLKLLSVHSGE